MMHYLCNFLASDSFTLVNKKLKHHGFAMYFGGTLDLPFVDIYATNDW
jgi:hypothetical protein